MFGLFWNKTGSYVPSIEVLKTQVDASPGVLHVAKEVRKSLISRMSDIWPVSYYKMQVL